MLHCPALVGGHAPVLAAAEREIGLDSRCVAFFPSPFGYEPDEILFGSAGPIRREVRRWRLLERAIRWADVVHFNFGASIMPRRRAPGAVDAGLGHRAFAAYGAMLELRDPGLLRRAGTGVAVTFQGDDARQGDRLVGDARILLEEVDPGTYVDDEQKRACLRTWARSANRIYALNPDLLRVLPPWASFVPYAHVDPRTWRPAEQEPDPSGHALRVAHAPTARGGKGTRFVLAAVRRLQDDGVAIELDLIEGVSHEQARARLGRADVVVDQLLLGWYGGISVEAMALGRAVVCFIDPADRALVDPGMASDLPIAEATRDSLANVLREMATDPGVASELGDRGPAFVRRWHDPLEVARRMERDYREMLA